MNIMMPLYSILTASYVYSLHRYIKKRAIKALLGIQYFILALVFIFSLLVCFHVFKFERPGAYVMLVATLLVIVYFCLKQDEPYVRLITLSVYASLLLNGVLNLHFYPSLLDYQGGSNMAQMVKEKDISVDNIYKISERHTWSLDFYNRKPVKITTLSALSKMEDVWVYADAKELSALREAGFDWDKQISVDQFRITRLQLKFLEPSTRYKKLNKMHLVHLY